MNCIAIVSITAQGYISSRQQISEHRHAATTQWDDSTKAIPSPAPTMAADTQSRSSIKERVATKTTMWGYSPR